MIDFLQNPDMNLLILTIYLALAFFAVESIAEAIKRTLRWFIDPDAKRTINFYERERYYNLERAKLCKHDEELKNGYLELAEQNLQEIKLEIRRKTPIKLETIIIPIGVGFLITLIFYPITIFYWLPFKPLFPFDFLITALIASRGANAAHGSTDKVSEFFSALIGRVAGKFF